MNDPLGLFETDTGSDPLGLFEDEPRSKADWGTALKQAGANFMNTTDKAGALLGGGVLSAVGATDMADEMYAKMQRDVEARNKWANPENQEIGFGGKLLNVVPGMLSSGLGPAETGMTLLDSGETLGTAGKGAAIDAVGNVAGMILPGFKQGSALVRGGTGFVANAAQDVATKAAIQGITETAKGKAAFQPTLEDAAVAGLTGGGFAVIGGRNKSTTPKSKLDQIKARQAEVEAAAVPKPVEQDPLVDTRDGTSLSKQAYEQALREKQLQRESAFNRPEQFGNMEVDTPMGRMARELGAEPGVVEQPLSRMAQDLTNRPVDTATRTDMDSVDAAAREKVAADSLWQDRTLGRQEDAQVTLDSRRAAMEQEVAQRTALEQQAATRARQEDAPIYSKEHMAEVVRIQKMSDAVFEKHVKDIEAQKAEADTALSRAKNEAAAQRALAAQKDIELRQRAIHDEVSRRGALDRGAQERGNQERGTIPIDQEKHPFVKAAEDKVMKAEQLLLKMTVAAEEGHPVPASQMARAKRDLVEFEKRAEKARQNTSGLRQGAYPEKKLPFNFKKQGGGLFLGEGKQELDAWDNMTAVADEMGIPKNPEVASVISKALSEGKDGKLFTYTQSGATSAAMKTGSAAIQAASRIIQNAGKRAEQATRNFIFPAENALRKLSSDEIVELHGLFKDEMFSGRRFNAEILADTLSVKQLDAYVHMRDMFDKALDAQNAERIVKGLKPVTANEAYLSSRWKGDFRRGVQNKDGNTVWYLAATSKMGLENQTKALLKKFPDLSYDAKKDHTVSSDRNKTELQGMYTTMLDILGRDDPAVEKIRKAIEEQTLAQGSSTLGQEKHFKHKANIRGFVGDRPGMDSNPKSEALAMFNEQLQYAKNALTWSEMQKAAVDIKDIVANPELQQQQPNNVKFIREYFKNAIGHNEARAVKQLSDNLREGLGVSPTVFNEAIGNVKSFFILQKLAASVGFTLANVVQTTNVLPYLVDLHQQGYKGNPATAMGVGFPGGLVMMASHYLKASGGEYIDRLPNQFLKDAIKYAEDNSVTSRSIYDESPLETGFSPVKSAVNMASKTMTIPETFVRSVAFMTYAQMLKDSGKYSDKTKLFQHAEELVNKSMVDYRATEKPLAFSKLGTLGSFLNTLQTYPVSFYNQYSYMAGQAGKGNKLPLVAMLATHAAMGGAMAIPYMEDLYKLFNLVKNNLVSDEMWKKMQDSPFLSDPKLWMMETLGKGSVYGYVSDQSGLGLSTRISAPSVGNMIQAPGGPVVDIAGQVGAVGSAVLNPTNSTKWAQAAMKVAPVGLQGLLETSGIMKDHTYVERPDGTRVYGKSTDLASRTGTITRSPEEDMVRKFGLRSQREVVEKEVQYLTGQANKAAKERMGSGGGSAGTIMEKLHDAMRRGDKQKVTELATLYSRLSGKAITEEMISNQYLQEYTTTLERAKARAEKWTPQEAVNNARMLSILGEK